MHLLPTVKDAYVCMCGGFISRTGNMLMIEYLQGNVFQFFANSRSNCENIQIGDKISFCRNNTDKICNKCGLKLLS